MKCNYKKEFFVILLFVFVVCTLGRGGGRGSSGGRTSSRSSSTSSRSGSSSNSGGGVFSNIFGGSKSSSSSSGSSSSNSYSGSYPKQTYSTGSNSNYGSRNNNNYGWNTNTGHGHYYNSHSSPTNWGSSGSTYHHQPQTNAFSNFHPVSSGIINFFHYCLLLYSRVPKVKMKVETLPSRCFRN